MSYRQSQTGSAASPAPRTSSSPRGSGVSPSAGRSITKRRSVGTSNTSSSRGSTLGSGLLRFYTEDSPGLKVGPTVVLVMSLLLISFVVLLHIWGKFHRA